MPPSSTISTTAAEVVKSTSLKVARPSAIAFNEPADAGERRGQHEEIHQLVAVDGVAQRNHARLIILDRAQDLAERRFPHPRHQKISGQKNRRGDVIHGEIVVEVDEARLASRAETA